MSYSSCTVRIQDSYDYIQPMLPESLNIGGVANQPVMGSVNQVIQRFLEPPFKWPWNRNTVTFLAATGVSDYTPTPTGTVTCSSTVVTWVSGTFFSPTWVGGTITISSSPYTVLSVTSPTLLTVTTGSPTSGSYSFPTLNDFGFIEKASFTQALQTPPQPTKEIPDKTLVMLAGGNETGYPGSIAPVFDNDAGIITFRLSPAPLAKLYGETITVIYQMAPPLITNLQGSGGTWAPIPDRYSRVYQTGLQYYMLMYSREQEDRQLLPLVRQDFLAGLLAISEGLDDTQKNSFREQWLLLASQSAASTLKTQQGSQARGA